MYLHLTCFLSKGPFKVLSVTAVSIMPYSRRVGLLYRATCYLFQVAEATTSVDVEVAVIPPAAFLVPVKAQVCPVAPSCVTPPPHPPNLNNI